MADFRKNELCVICSHEKQSLMVLFCGHVFCEQCLSAHKSFQERSCCPICGTSRDGRRYTLKRKASEASIEDSPISLSLASEISIEQSEGYVSDDIVGSETELDDLDHSDNNNYDNHYREFSMECIECTDDDETINSN